MKLIYSIVFSILFTIFGTSAYGLSELPSRATIVEIKKDKDGISINNKKAKLLDTAKLNDRVSTKITLAQLRFNNGVVARLAENSLMIIGRCLRLNRGRLLISGKANTCTPSSVAGVRGTIYEVVVDDFDNTTYIVYEGSIFIETVGKEYKTLKEGQSLVVNKEGSIVNFKHLNSEEYKNFLTDSIMTDFNTVLPKMNLLLRNLRYDRSVPRIPNTNLGEINL